MCVPSLRPPAADRLTPFCSRVRKKKEGKLERELAEEMTGHVVRGIPAETPPTHRPLVLAKTVEGETPLMAAAGCPSPSCVELVR